MISAEWSGEGIGLVRG